MLIVGDLEYALPESTDPYIKMGNDYLSEHALTQARQWYAKADTRDGTAAYYLAIICIIEGDTDNMVSHLLAAIEGGNARAMNRLAYYYQKIQDYDNMQRYYLLAISHGNSSAMNNLGMYYYELHDYDLALKYYTLAIEKGSPCGANNLAIYYQEHKDYDAMLKYYLLAIENDDSNAMFNLGLYYQTIKDYDAMFKYYLLAIEHDNMDAAKNLGNYYRKMEQYDEAIKYYLLSIDDNTANFNYCLSKIAVCEPNLLLAHRKYLNKGNSARLNDVMVKNIRTSASEPKKKCHICFEKMLCVKLLCNHELCTECFCKINNNTSDCPYCRMPMTFPDAFYNAK